MIPLAMAIDWHSVFFLLYALLACGFAIAMLASSNIVRMAFYLTLSLGATAGLFFLAGAEFLGAMQLMIYVGGTLVLLIFGVMLTAQDRFISMKTGAGEWVLGGIVGASLLLLLLRAGMGVERWKTPHPDRATITMADAKTTAPIGLALTGVRVDRLDPRNERLANGFSGYLLPFVIVSMHLLVVLIGAGYMARSKRAARGCYGDRLVATPRQRPRRRFLVTAGVVSGVVFNLVLAIACFAAAARPQSTPAAATSQFGRWMEPVTNALASAPSVFWMMLGGLFLLNILFLAVVHLWQRWGVLGLISVPIIQALVVLNAGLGGTAAIVLLLATLAPVALIVVLLNAGPKPTLWSQMD